MDFVSLIPGIKKTIKFAFLDQLLIWVFIGSILISKHFTDFVSVLKQRSNGFCFRHFWVFGKPFNSAFLDLFVREI